MNELRIFSNTDFGKLTVSKADDTIYFLLGEVCKYLGYTKQAKGNTYLRKDKIVNICESLKIKGLSPSDNFEIITVDTDFENTMITEDALYDLILESKAKNARKFRKWVTLEVLPQIRQTGGYIETDREAEFIDKYFPSFTEETKLSMVQDLRKQNEEYKRQIAELEPQAQAYSDLMVAQGYLQFLDIAALVDIGRNTLLQFLRKCKVLTKQSNYNIPYGRFLKNGMFKVITSRSENGHISSVTMVSPKGLNYIYKLMKKKDALDDFNTTALLKKIKELEVA